MGNVAGIDWASERHDVWVSDGAGEKLLAATYAHDEAGLSSLCKVLMRLRVELVAIERPDGLLVERLLDAGLRVPRSIPTRWRPRATGFASRAGSQTGLTRSCSASSRALTRIASGCLSPTAMRLRR